MAVTVGHYATHVVDILICVSRRLLRGIVLENLHDPPTAIDAVSDVFTAEIRIGHLKSTGLTSHDQQSHQSRLSSLLTVMAPLEASLGAHPRSC